ncbi:hypothetical protein HanPSC8_Chr10g0437591 [Helianthus annuus]|nr:hypothetical protein HanPSC8_Chr10g0437591 [Helianthus annuus]
MKHSHTKHLKIDEVQLLCAYYYEFKIQDACDPSNSLEKWRKWLSYILEGSIGNGRCENIIQKTLCKF